MESAANNPENSSSDTERDQSHLVKGKLVNVISRTWPGINKPGGIGKITKVYTEESTQRIKCVDVKYIVHGGTDKVIPVEFVESHEYEANRRATSFDPLSARCTRCKSFRRDCGSCDYRFAAEDRARREREEEERKKKKEEEEERQRREEEEERRRLEDGMDSEEEEAYMDRLHKRYRKLCRDKNAREGITSKKKKKKQQRRKNEEKQREESDSDEENETLALIEKEKEKKLRRKKMNRRKQLKNTSVLASLPSSLAEPIVPASSNSDSDNAKEIEDDKGNNVGESNAVSNENEEMELNFTADNVDPTSAIDIDTDEDKTAANEFDDDSSIENINGFDVEDDESSSDDSDDDSDDDDDILVVDLIHRDKTDDTEVSNDDNGEDRVKSIISELENKAIPYVKEELKSLNIVFIELKRSMIKNDCLDEIDELAEKTNSLHEYVVTELIRNGIDRCNGIIDSLSSNSNRRKKTAGMSKSERSNYYEQIDALDLAADNVGKSVEEVDNDVTKFQKEVDRIQYEAEEDLQNYFLDSDPQTSHTVHDKPKRQRNSSEKEWDPHQHATHKRKSSSSKNHASNKKRAKSMSQPGAKSSHASSAKEREFASDINQHEDSYDDTLEFDITSDAETESRADSDIAATTFQSIDHDSIGETDDLDNGPAIRDTTRSWYTSSKSHRKESSGMPRKSSGRIRRASTKTRPKERVPTYRHIHRGSGSKRATSSNNSSQALIEMDRGNGTSTLSSRASQRTDSSHSTRSTVAGHRQTGGRSSVSTSSRRERVVQHFLKPENLFNSLIAAPQEGNVQTRGVMEPNQSHELHNVNSSTSTATSRPLNELCTSLRESYPQGVGACRETLSVLSHSVPNGNEDVVTLFQTLQALLKEKCSTLLDALNCDSQIACFQIDCWCLVFRLMEQGYHSQLPKEELLWAVFGNSAVFARQVLLQIIDVLYSQLLGDAYGDAPRLTDQVFGRMRSLSRQIGKVVPILPELPNLFRNLPGQLWYSSLIYDQKENTSLEKALYVSMLDPKLYHERFMISGEVEKTNNENRRIDLYNKNIPRQEINALWTTIGFFANASPLPSKKKDKTLAGFVQSLLQSKCGVLYSSLDTTGIPATEIHLNRCLHEMKWLCHLLSKSMLGELSFAANFVPGIVKKAILLESTSVTMHMRPTAPGEKVDQVMRKLWNSSCLGSSEQIFESHSFNSILAQNRLDDVWSFVPSTSLSQTCASLVEIYAATASKKTAKAHWNNFSREVDKLAASLAAKAKEADLKPNSPQTSDVGVSFADLFSEVEVFSEAESVASPKGAYLRETACFSLISCIIASTRSDSFIPTPTIALNKSFREKITNLSSDEYMQEHHKYIEGASGEVPKSTSNINLLFTSSKVLSVTTLLHLSASHDNIDRMGMDADVSMLDYLVSSIVSNLSMTIDKMQSLNMNVQGTKSLFDLSACCIHIIKSTAMWLGLIFDRAAFVIENVSASASSNKLSTLYAAIKKLSQSTCDVATKVLINALEILFNTASTNKHGKSLNVYFALDKAFHCCLAAIRKAVCLFHTCGGNSVGDAQSMISVLREYQRLMTLKVIPTTIGLQKSDVQELCSRQSDGLLSVLAALCSTCSVPQTLYRDMFSQRKQTDDSQLIQHLRVVFSCELTRLTTGGFSKCEAVMKQHFKDILNDTIVSMVDFQSIQALPTSNTALLQKLGGEYSRSYGIKKLEKLSSSTYANDFGYADQNLWHWWDDVAKLFREWNLGDGRTDHDKMSWINSVGQVIKSSCAHIRASQDSLNAESAEKECEMRRELLRSIFTSMKRKSLSFGDLPRDIAICITKNLFFLSKTVSYHEEKLRWGCDDNDTLYERAEIRAHEEAYINFCASVLIIMLKENGHCVQILRPVVKRLEAPGVYRTEKGNLLKLLSRVFEDFSKDSRSIDNRIISAQKNVEAYCAMLHTLKTSLCDLFVAGTDDEAIKNIFSCALHIANLHGNTSSNNSSEHMTYIHEFTNWLNICGILMLKEDLLPEMLSVVAKLNAVKDDGKDDGKDKVPMSPTFTRLGDAFGRLVRLEKTLKLRTINPYAKQHASSTGHLDQNLKLSRSCLKTIKDFTDSIATSPSDVN